MKRRTRRFSQQRAAKEKRKLTSPRAIYRAGRRLGISWTPGPGMVAGRGVGVVVAGGLLVVVGFGVGALGVGALGVGALGAVAGRVGDFAFSNPGLFFF